MIMTAVRENDGEMDPDMNPALAAAIEKAKKEDMPKENIKKAIKKGAGEGEEGALEDFTLEVYGPDGLAVILQGATDNKNRTVAQINQILKPAGGKLAKPGSVTWLFDRKGVIEIKKSEENELMAIEAGAEDIRQKEDKLLIYTAPDELGKIKKKIKEKTDVESAKLGYKPKAATSKKKYESFLEKLEEHEEVEQLYFTIK